LAPWVLLGSLSLGVMSSAHIDHFRRGLPAFYWQKFGLRLLVQLKPSYLGKSRSGRLLLEMISDLALDEPYGFGKVTNARIAELVESPHTTVSKISRLVA
jgi:hypothetical protein